MKKGLFTPRKFMLACQGMVFNVEKYSTAAGTIPCVEGISECGRFGTKARTEDVRWLKMTPEGLDFVKVAA